MSFPAVLFYVPELCSGRLTSPYDVGVKPVSVEFVVDLLLKLKMSFETLRAQMA